MKPQHTPAPWEVVRRTNSHLEIEAPNQIVYSAKKIAMLSATNFEANARLIAAAPDLLEALTLALEYWAHREQRYKNRSPVWVQEARVAIAKATGEQP